MAEWIGINRRARRCYGFDEIALVPGSQTVNPNEVNTSFKFNGKNFKIPILAAAMDGVVDVKFAVEMSRLGGIAVLNLDGIQTRYENPDEVLEEISLATPQKATELIQTVYTTPIKEKLVTKRVAEIKKAKAMAVVSCIPANAEKFSKLAIASGADIFVVQSTVT
ncbi:MAG: IMP dehydrogenase, partial [Candidatus Omnitrophota bacterium]